MKLRSGERIREGETKIQTWAVRSVPGRVRVWVTGIVLAAWEFRASGSRRMQSHPVLGES